MKSYFTLLLLVFWSFCFGQEIKLGLPLGHSGHAIPAEFSPDGKLVLTGSADSSAKLWDSETGKLIHSLEGHSNMVHSTTFSPDGKKIATSSWDGTAKLWDTETGEIIYSYEKHSDTLYFVTFSPDGSRILTASKDGTAKLWSVLEGNLLHSFDHHGETVYRAKFSPDGKKSITGSWDGTAKIWDNNSGRLINTLKDHEGHVTSVSFSPSGNHVMTASLNGSVKIWKLLNGMLEHSFNDYKNKTCRAVFSEIGNYILIASSGKTEIKKINSKKTISSFVSNKNNWYFDEKVFSKDGKKVLIANFLDEAELRDVNTGDLIHLLDYKSHLYSTEFSPEGNKILTSHANGTVNIWDVNTGQLIHSLESKTHAIKSAEFNQDDSKILLNIQGSMPQIIDSSTGKGSFISDGLTTAMKSIDLSPDGKHILISSSNYMETYSSIFDIDLNRITKKLENGKSHNISRFYSNGQYCFTGHQEGSISIWNVLTTKQIKSIKAHSSHIVSIIVNPKDESLITRARDDDYIKVWDSSNGQLNYTFENYSSASPGLSASGEQIATAGLDNKIKIWNLNNGQLMCTLEGHDKRITRLEFSHDHKYLLSSSNDATILWDLESRIQLKLWKGYYSSPIISPDGSKTFLDHWGNSILFDNNSQKTITLPFKNKNPVRFAKFSPNGRILLTASNKGDVSVWDLNTYEKLFSYSNNYYLSPKTMFFTPDSKSLWFIKDGHTLKSINFKANKLLTFLDGHKSEITMAKFDLLEPGLIITSAGRELKFWDFGIEKRLKTNNSIVWDQMSNKGDKVMVTQFFRRDKKSSEISKHEVNVFDKITGNLLASFLTSGSRVKSLGFSSDDETILIANDSLIESWSLRTNEKLTTLKGHSEYVTNAIFSNNGKYLLTSAFTEDPVLWEFKTGKKILKFKNQHGYHNSSVFTPKDQTILIARNEEGFLSELEVSSGNLIKSEKAHSLGITSIKLSNKKDKIISTSKDGSFVIWKSGGVQQLIRFFMFDGDPNKWLHLHPGGLFDASPEAMKLMYYTYGLEVLEFQQLKELYWEPDLWPKVMNNEPLRDVPSKEELKNYLPPKVEYPKQLAKNSYTIPVTVTKREGGLGVIRVYVNGVEIAHDLNQQVDSALAVQKLKLVLDPKKDLPNGKNSISIIAETANGKVTSNRGAVPVSNNKNLEDPSFYGVIIGVGDYPDGNFQDLDLQFAEKDVQAMGKALKLATPSFFKKRSFYKLSTHSKKVDSLPNKTNIEKVFSTIAEKAGPNDVVWVHFSGHGKAIPRDGSEDKDIHLLLNDWVNIDMDGPGARDLIKQRSISGDELKEMLKKIKANKRVVVLDACEAGSFYNEKSGGNTIAKSLDRLRTASGAAMIMGSQEDQASYETSNYEMGLLTYSLLEGIKNTPQSSPINSLKILQHAEERVQDLAEELGVKQQPKIIGTANFPFGSLDEKANKNFPSLRGKPVVKEIRLTSKTRTTRDPLGLTDKAIQAIKDYVDGEDELFSYFSIDSGNNEYYTLAGHYTKSEEGQLILELDLYNNQNDFSKSLILNNKFDMNLVIQTLEDLLGK
ncbi:caspase family protein [Flagellimonas onchidii]|uniref:caspase family protein n=1 Tax=Flagellimonas onchidii TaxID=2562684 RepID=UPI0010A662EE|nr:caspase family protein [Allomuricauda onchidii]